MGDQALHCIWEYFVYPFAILLSCIVIVVTLFVYLTVPEIYKRLPSKCVISESLSILLSYISMISLPLIIATARKEDTSSCIAVGLLIYYSTLASFFWLNVMCFDLYFTIKSLVPVNDRGSSNNVRFLKYSVYGWGAPLIFVLFAFIMDNIKLENENPYIIRPQLFTYCMIVIKDKRAVWAYLYGPILILLLINLILFMMVAISLVKQKRRIASDLRNNESQTHAGGAASKNMSNANESAILCIKLFLVMGITWIPSLFSPTVKGNSYCYLWFFINLTNYLRGFFVFLIFVCKKDVKMKFKVAWRKRLGMKPPVISSPKASDIKSKTNGTHWWNKMRKSDGDEPSSTITTSTTPFAISSPEGRGAREVSAALQNDIELMKIETNNDNHAFRYENDDINE